MADHETEEIAEGETPQDQNEVITMTRTTLAHALREAMALPVDENTNINENHHNLNFFIGQYKNNKYIYK